MIYITRDSIVIFTLHMTLNKICSIDGVCGKSEILRDPLVWTSFYILNIQRSNRHSIQLIAIRSISKGTSQIFFFVCLHEC